MSDQVAALLHEMEQHVMAGRVERVAQIKDELAALGHKLTRDESAPAAKAVQTTAAPRAKK